MIDSLVAKLMERPSEAFRQAAFVTLAVTAAVACLFVVVAVVVRVRGGARLPPVRGGLWGKLVYGLVLVCVACLAGTSLAYAHMGGWLLAAHMAAAGPFMVLLALLALSWAGSCRFGGRSGLSPQRFLWPARFCFWLILLAGTVTAGTMLAAMLPLFGTDALRRLADVHRYAGLVTVACCMLHLSSLWAGRLLRG